MKKTVLIAMLMVGSLAMAQEADTLKTGQERRSNQNVMLNASYASIPRTISLGIPEWGTYIMDDGLPALTSMGDMLCRLPTELLDTRKSISILSSAFSLSLRA